MEAYIIDWLNLLVRWAHMIVGIAWIGASFYFVWLDNHLLPPVRQEDQADGVGGEVWSVHGGGFYHAQKYTVAPPSLPSVLHWFKWEAYSTWLTGMFLVILIYWYGAEIYMVDPSAASITPWQAVMVAIGAIVLGWFIYDGICRSPFGDNEKLIATLLLGLCTALAWLLCKYLSGRAAYIHFGVVLGTIMVANVFFVIIPAQRTMVNAAEAGETPPTEPGLKAKQRSVHNTYFTLPVLFTMTSNHFPLTYGHSQNWLVLIAIALVGALIRVHFVARHKGRPSPWPLLIALVLLAAVIATLVPRSTTAQQTSSVDFHTYTAIIAERCTPCHSANPTHPAFLAAPGGVVLDTPTQIRAESARILQQTVTSNVMPIGNLTGMTDDERLIVAQWISENAREFAQ